jgi:predicted short-subunit dehydrogenase-like oxidoreductase (DUF2520 family)
VAHHLANAIIALQSNDFVLLQIFARNPEKWIWKDASVVVSNQWESLQPTEWVILCVKDEAIAEVSKQIPWEKALVIHTSGSTSVEVIAQKNKGVFYPLQTFSKTTDVQWKEIPIALEANHPEHLLKMETLAKMLSNKVAILSEEQRSRLHLAAVFSCNFANHLYHIAANLLEKEQLHFDWMLPLIQATTTKLEKLSPKDAQTGPALRNDVNTINKQLAQLPEKEREIYDLLTKSIQAYHLKNE